MEISLQHKQEDYAVEPLTQTPPQTMYIKMCGLYRVKRLCPCQCSSRLLAFLVKGDGFEATIEKSS
jgi:hypothetical protein